MLLPLVMLSLTLVFTAAAIWLSMRPQARAARLLQRANGAMGSRRHDEALGYFDRADALRGRIRNEKARNSVGFAIAQGRGMCWVSARRFPEAEQHIRMAIDLLEATAEQEHRIVVYLHCNLMLALLGQGKEPEGADVLAKVDELCGETSVGEAEGVAEMLVGASAGAASHNHFSAAFRLARKAVEVLSQADSWYGGHLAGAKIHLGAIHALVGEYRQARELVEQVITSTEDGQLDGRTRANAFFNSGELCMVYGEFPRAVECLEKCIDFRVKEYGPDHFQTGIAVVALAGVHRAGGEYRKAETLFRKGYGLQTEQLREDDSILTQTAVMFALLLCDLGKYEEADRLLRTAEAVPVKIAKCNSNALPAVRLVRGIWYLDRFQFDEAIACLREALRFAQALYGEASVMTSDYSTVLSLALVRAGQLDEAKRLLGEALATSEAVENGHALGLADLLLSFAEMYLADHRPEEAEAAALRAWETVADKLFPTNLTLAYLHTALADALARRGNHTEAMNHLRKAEEIHRQVQPPDHPRIAYLCDAAVNVYRTAGDVESANRCRREGARIRARFA
jgi:tetratricopeptide (TPR) repeat protein